MSDGTITIRRKIKTAEELQAVVRTMKALASSSIGQYENSLQSLADYDRTIQLGLGASLRKIDQHTADHTRLKATNQNRTEAAAPAAIVFGSDQGLVGHFNEEIVDFTVKSLAGLKGSPQLWAIGARVHERLIDAGLKPLRVFDVPNSINAITPLVAQLQIEIEASQAQRGFSELFVFHNRPSPGTGSEPTRQTLLPLDRKWHDRISKIPWPTATLPQVMGTEVSILHALIREYLFISLFKASAESLASENASRLAAMERADKNINELLETLQVTSHRLRQQSIDEELFDVIAGFQALRVLPVDDQIRKSEKDN